MGRKGQISIEYMAVFAIAALMTLPLILIFSVQSSNVKTDITLSQAEKVASEIINSAKEVYFMGPPAQKTIQVEFPEGIESVTVSPTYILFVLETNPGTVELYKESSFELQGAIEDFSGPHVLIIKAENNHVSIEEKR